MTILLQKQKEFAKLIPRLIDKAHELGYEVTIGDAYRDPRAFGAMGSKIAYGHPRSAHKIRLAVDLNLFRDGVFMQTTADHRALGTWWQQQHPSARWGGTFDDGNHYSFEHEGVK
jgi:hypothetical protein